MCIEKCGSLELSCSNAESVTGAWQRHGRKLALASAVIGGSLGLVGAGQASAIMAQDAERMSTTCEDTDGDGWGWTGTESCRADRVVSEDANGSRRQQDANDTADRAIEKRDKMYRSWEDGFSQVAKPNHVERNRQNQVGVVCEDSDGDGWGWNGTDSCRMPERPSRLIIDDVSDPVAPEHTGTDLSGCADFLPGFKGPVCLDDNGDFLSPGGEIDEPDRLDQLTMPVPDELHVTHYLPEFLPPVHTEPDLSDCFDVVSGFPGPVCLDEIQIGAPRETSHSDDVDEYAGLDSLALLQEMF